MTDFIVVKYIYQENSLIPLVSLKIALLYGDYLSVTYPKRYCWEDLLVCRVWDGLFLKPLVLRTVFSGFTRITGRGTKCFCNCLKRNTSAYINSVDLSPGSTGVTWKYRCHLFNWLPPSTAVICLTMYLCTGMNYWLPMVTSVWITSKYRCHLHVIMYGYRCHLPSFRILCCCGFLWVAGDWIVGRVFIKYV